MKNWLTQNSKLKKTSKKEGERAFNWGIPALKSASGFATCPNAGACALGCYAQAGAYRFSNVAATFERRLALTRSAEFEATILAELRRKRVSVLRVHDSGDFYSEEYARRWFAVMRAAPKVKFYAYTKQVAMFKAMRLELPANFTLIYSFGGKQDKLIDVKRDRHSLVFETLEDLKAAGYVDTTENDLNAIKANPRVGLVYHGTKNIENTAWQRVPALRKAG